MKRILALATAAVAALAFSSSALASSLTCGHGATCQNGMPTGANTGGVGTLPFTGLDLATVAIVAGLLLAAGLTLHRMGRRRQ